VGVVIATRDRRDSVLATLARLATLPERPPVVVADNGSRDGTPQAVRSGFPAVQVLELGRNAGGAARTEGARILSTRHVAFCDDDSWWQPGSLERAGRLLDEHPAVGLLAGRVLVGVQRRLDPVCAAMAASPLPARDGFAGRPVLGFVACGAVARREALLAVGGFDERYGIGGEEARLAIDLRAAGWGVFYAPSIVAVHCPALAGTRPGRTAVSLRNDLWTAWLRRPAGPAAAATARLVAGAARRRPLEASRGVLEAVAGLPRVLRERAVVSPELEAELARLDG
jgi:GT2 family glycosyltransferase